jgi:hypothetical protein
MGESQENKSGFRVLSGLEGRSREVSGRGGRGTYSSNSREAGGGSRTGKGGYIVTKLCPIECGDCRMSQMMLKFLPWGSGCEQYSCIFTLVISCGVSRKTFPLKVMLVRFMVL